MKLHIFFCCFILITHVAHSEGIKFYESISYSDALALATTQGKLLFVDTYTKWCVPCKKMEPIFLDKEVGNFFNSHFINVRIDMETSAYANEYKEALEVIFLPTLAMLRADGFLRFKIDKGIDKQELMDYGYRALDGGDYTISLSTKVESSPIDSPETIILSNTQDNGHIKYVMGQSYDKLPPELLKSLAYQCLVIGNGKQAEVAKAYLSKQTDWSTKDNLRFILDFVSDTRSKEFAYLIANKQAFYDAFGVHQVERTIQILIYLQLHHAFPRPTFDESMAMFKISSPNNFQLLCYQYFLTRLQDECRIESFEPIALQYLTKVNSTDDYYMYVLADYYLNTTKSATNALKWIDKAIKIQKNNAEYHFLKGEILHALGKTKKAVDSVEKAITLNSKAGRETENYLKYKMSLLQNSY
ncbi:MAG: thioredoxin family protein [Saprospiraceae bacterium]